MWFLILSFMLSLSLCHFTTLAGAQDSKDGALVAHKKTHVDNNPHQRTTVVTAAALTYGITSFRQFILPLRRVYDGDVVLFVSDKLKRNVVELCAKYNISTRALPTGSRLGLKGNRYIGYAEVCADYHWCFATDFRDVFFQANPFATLPVGYDLVLAEEFSPVKIETCPFNREWIQTCFGTKFLREIGQNTPICSGTIMGTPRGFKTLMNGMLQALELTKDVRTCTSRDQGLLNYLYFANKLSVPVQVQPRGNGIVNTVGYITPRYTIRNYMHGSSGLVRNNDGTVSPVVHQYDRFPELKTLLSSLIKNHE